MIKAAARVGPLRELVQRGETAAMNDQERITVGSVLPPPGDRVGDVDPDEMATITLYLRRRADLPSAGDRLTREEFAGRHGSGDDDLAQVADFAGAAGLTVGEVDRARRSVQLSGRLADLAVAFGVELGRYGAGGVRSHPGPVSLPGPLVAAVTGVYGLDQRPQASPRVIVAAAQGGTAYTPVQVAAAYDYPASTDGTGECVGLIELGGGFRQSDLDSYFSGLGVASPTVTAVPVDGGTNSPTTAAGADTEVMLDIEVVGAVAPGARIAVYFAPNTDQGFLDAVTTAVHDTTNAPSVISISWGGAESTWTTQAMDQMEAAMADAATLGVTVTVAAGDNGSSDGQTDGLAHVDFPASAPHALACGGTTLDIDDTAITSEVVWNELAQGEGATGGGVSAVFPVPTWQASADVPPSANSGGGTGRGVPDVTGNADPTTGYSVLVDGTTQTVGGTSAVAPLWAALIARCNQALGHAAGFVSPQLYAAGLSAPATGAIVHDITSGTNGAYTAGPGWDACSGLGSPIGQALLTALQGAPAPTPTT